MADTYLLPVDHDPFAAPVDYDPQSYVDTRDIVAHTPQESLWDKMKGYAAPATEMWRNSESSLAQANEQFNQRAAGDLGILMGRHIDPEEMTGVGALIGGVKAPGPRAPVRIENPIKAYHGSPHDFDAFDLSKIGTGEGAQAYGHGLYFAENEGVAQRYRDALAGIADPNTMTAADYAGHHLSFTRMGGEVPEAEARQRSIAMLDAAIQDAKEDASTSWLSRILNRPSATNPLTGQPSAADVPVEKLREARDLIAAGKENPNPQIGRMYEVALHATPEQFLDWDRPLSGQSPEIQRAALGLSRPPDPQGLREMAAQARQEGRHGEADFLEGQAHSHETQVQNTGQNALIGLARRDNAYDYADASNRLRESGIPGIRYLDQGSRFTPDLQEALAEQRRRLQMYQSEPKPDQRLIDETSKDIERLQQKLAMKPTSNYVIWSPEIIEILRKYGIAGLSMLPPAVAASVRQNIQPVDHDPFAQ